MNIFVPSGWEHLAKLFKGSTTVYNVEEADLVIFGVTPSYYGANKSRHTHNNPYRDEVEEKVFQYCVDNSIPMMGICRGSQFLCVMNGGKLVQDVDGHAIGGLHEMRTNEFFEEEQEIILVTSTHHQMAYPFEMKNRFRILAYSESARSAGYYLMDDNTVLTFITYEPEVIYYPETNSIGFQYHPEYMDENSRAVKYTLEMVEKYLFKK